MKLPGGLHYEILAESTHLCLWQDHQEAEDFHFFLSYLLRGKQNILIDTVPDKAADAYIQDIESVLPVSRIDALILNHSEEDHSGALQAVLDRHPQLPIYCTPATKERLQPTYPDADFRVVQHGESLTLGDYTFQFIHTPGLHWPDNMVTWLASEKSSSPMTSLASI